MAPERSKETRLGREARALGNPEAACSAKSSGIARLLVCNHSCPDTEGKTHDHQARPGLEMCIKRGRNKDSLTFALYVAWTV